ncbi:hypothetical protein [uncultured Algibacter sp.]|uniref:hypothetical protein n=1 Tax=uncultured Algibacter sp. TaxID=298659 RepID=UPI00260CB371|nr:hypothetical protein [uncultured Algibacter sp.]
MINFFRRIRQRLLSEKKFSKYLLYALGEILLVMVGILLALEVNQWNEEKNDQRIENTALLNLKAEFITNQEHFNILYDIKFKNEKKYRSYLNIIGNDTIPFDIKVKASPANLMDGYWHPTNEALKSLMNTGYLDKIKNDSLKTLLINWTKNTTMMSHFEERVYLAYHNQKTYLNEHVYQSVVKERRYTNDIWPGASLPKNIQEKKDKIWSSLIDDIAFFNVFSTTLLELYHLNTFSNHVKSDLETITRLIDEELKIRKVIEKN